MASESSGPEPASPVIGARTVRNISWLTLSAGIVGGVLAFMLQRDDWAKGIFLGALLAWLNFRWIRRGVGTLLAAGQNEHETEKPRANATAVVLFVLFR